MTQSLLTLSDFGVFYHNNQIVKGVSCTVNKGELVALLGANGSGKTTLMKGICALAKTSGTCEVQGQAVSSLTPRQRAQKIAYIPQRSGITFSVSVLDTVLMGYNSVLPTLASPNAEQRICAQNMLAEVGMAHRGDDDFLTLSEGQKQLVILARALVQQAQLLLFDEPDSALDFNNKRLVLKKIADILKTQQKSGILCLHDANFALKYCSRLLILKDGLLVADVSPKLDAHSTLEKALRLVYNGVMLAQHGENYIMMEDDDAAEY